MKSEILSITPSQAERWLEMKGKNRKVSLRHVKYLAAEIISGRWRLTHQGIAFGDDGRLLDGQHRLAAIVEAGLTTNMMVTTGVPIGEFSIVDRGMPRNVSTITGIPSFYTECYVFMITISKGNKLKPSPDNIYQLHEKLAYNADLILNKCNSSTRFYSSAPIRTAALVSLELGEDIEYILETYRNLVLQKLNRLPSIALALVKWYNQQNGINRRSINAGYFMRLETYARARYLFKKINFNLDKIRIPDELMKKYAFDVVDIVERILKSEVSSESRKLAKELKIKETEIIEKNKQIRNIQEKLLKKTYLDIDAEQYTLSREASE